MLLYKNRKNSWLSAFGTFDCYAKTLWITNEKQHHIKIPVETQYIIPFSNDLWYKTKSPPRNSNGENESTKKTKMWGSITDFNFDGRKKIWSVIKRHQQWKEQHEKSPFYHSETLFFLQFNDPDWPGKKWLIAMEHGIHGPFRSIRWLSFESHVMLAMWNYKRLGFVEVSWYDWNTDEGYTHTHTI